MTEAKRTFLTVPGREHALRLQDGRQLAYSEYGPEDGRLVIFLPGAGLGRRMQFGGPFLSEYRIRLLSIDRPGLGRSTPDPHKTFGSVGQDLHTLLEALRQPAPVPIIANSQGAPFGLAAALQHLTNPLILVSPIDELAHPAIRGQIPAPLGDLVDQVGRLDRAAGTNLFRRYSAAELFDLIIREPPLTDAAIYSDPNFRRLLQKALHDGFSGGAAGYAADTQLAMSRWDLPLDQISTHVSLWYGADDHTHSPDQGLAFAARIPGSSRHIIDHVGGSLLWARSELILSEAFRRTSNPTARTPTFSQPRSSG